MSDAVYKSSLALVYYLNILIPNPTYNIESIINTVREEIKEFEQQRKPTLIKKIKDNLINNTSFAEIIRLIYLKLKVMHETTLESKETINYLINELNNIIIKETENKIKER